MPGPHLATLTADTSKMPGEVPQKISEDQVSQKIHSKAGALKIL